MLKYFIRRAVFDRNKVRKIYKEYLELDKQKEYLSKDTTKRGRLDFLEYLALRKSIWAKYELAVKNYYKNHPLLSFIFLV